MILLYPDRVYADMVSLRYFTWLQANFQAVFRKVRLITIPVNSIYI